MKMSFRLKALAGAIALLAAGAAEAAIVTNDANTGNSDFLFTAFDSNGKSYVLGLNLRLDDVVANPTQTHVFNLPSLSSFFSDAQSTDARWSVVAADRQATGTFKNFRVITSFDPTVANGPTNVTASGTKGAALNFDAFLNLANGTSPTPVVGTPVMTTSPADPAYAGQAIWGGDWGGVGLSDVTFFSNPDQTAVAWLLNSGNALNGIAKPALTQLDKWQLNLSTNTLTYAPVPVPAAVWLFGSALAGMAARRRRG